MNGTLTVILSFLISLTAITKGKEKPLNISWNEIQNTTFIILLPDGNTVRQKTQIGLLQNLTTAAGQK